MEQLPLVQFIFPMAAALSFFLFPLAPRKSKIFSLLAAVLHLGVTLGLYQNLLESGKDKLPLLFWNIPYGPHFSFSLDGEKAPFLMLNALVLLFTVFLSWDEKRKLHKIYYFLIFLLGWSVNACLLSDKFSSFFILEEFSILIFLLFMRAFGHRKKEGTGSFENDGLILFGSFLLLVFHVFQNTDREWACWAGMAGFFIRSALFPFHLLRTRAAGHMSRTAFIISQGIIFNIGFYGIMKFMRPLFPVFMETYRECFIWLGLGSVLVGAVFSFFQQDLYKILSYSSLSYFGQAMTGIFIGQAWTVKGSLLRLFSHCLTVMALFLLKDLMEKNWSPAITRALKVAGILVFCNFIGLPGLMGFGGNFLLLAGMVRENPLWAAVSGVSDILVPIALYQFLGNWKIPSMSERVEFDEGIDEVLTIDMEKDYLGLLLLFLICTLFLVLGLFPQLFESTL